MAEENKVESGVVLPPADFTEQLQKEAQEMGVTLNEHQIKQFYDYYELLIHWNTMVNLTAITEQKEVVTKHFSDSLALVKAVPDLAEKEYTLIDVGTGAGFPGIPLKIAFPNLKVTLLDSLNKRINFLNEVIQALELEKIQAVHGRAEDAAHDNVSRETFDFCVSRAVANLSTLSEYCLPFVKVGGWFVPYKRPGSSRAATSASSASAARSTTSPAWAPCHATSPAPSRLRRAFRCGTSTPSPPRWQRRQQRPACASSRATRKSLGAARSTASSSRRRA